MSITPPQDRFPSPGFRTGFTFLKLMLAMGLLSSPLLGGLVTHDTMEAQPFTNGSPAGNWVRGSSAYWENYAGGNGIFGASTANLGTRAISLNPDPTNSWLYRNTGQSYLPNTTYHVKLYAGSRKDTAFHQGGPIEFGLWSGVPAQPATAPPLPPIQAGGNLADTSNATLFPAQTMVPVETYSFTTGADVSGMGNIVVFIRNLASVNGRSTIDSVTVEFGPRPNILWLVAEDMSPTLGSYGDPNAITPRLDSLASQGLKFTRCWSNAPFCSVARTTLITGTHAVRTGGSMHRSSQTLSAPAFMSYYPRLVQENGYYTSNRSKEDYNVQPPVGLESRKGWNDSSGAGHWRNRPAGQPFLSVFNLDDTHESRIRTPLGSYPVTPVHNPANIVLPECHPDIPSLRQAWASHHDYITKMDGQAGEILDQLEADGLADDTIVFFFTDHGSCVPGFKRFVGNRGQQVPLIVRFPPKYAHLAPGSYAAGATTGELVSFVDFAPTLLSLMDGNIPEWMHGRAFAGTKREAPPDHLFGYICRHDTRYANARSVTDGRYVYIRNYQADTPHGNWSVYTNGNSSPNPATATLGAWEWLDAFHHGGLSARKAHYYINSGPEQLYDLSTDRYETINRAGDPALASVLASMREALTNWQSEIRDGGLIPEGRLYDLVQSTGLSAWDVIGNDTHFPSATVLDTAKRASSGNPADTALLVQRLGAADATVRLWAARGLAYHGRETVRANQSALLNAAITDADYWVRISARQALAKHASEPVRGDSVDALFDAASVTGVVTDGVTDRALERKIHFAGDAISSLSHLDASYRARTNSMNGETYLTLGYRRQLYYWFYDEYHHPLAGFRQTHGLDKTGADDLDNPSGDGISNFVRYAFGLSPNDGDLLRAASPSVMPVGGTAGLPVLFRDSPDGLLRYQYVRRKSTSDPRVDYTRWSSADLKDWTPYNAAGETVQSVNTDFERVTVPAGEQDNKFFRVQVRK